jgi:hypothetical protein
MQPFGQTGYTRCIPYTAPGARTQPTTIHSKHLIFTLETTPNYTNGINNKISV